MEECRARIEEIREDLNSVTNRLDNVESKISAMQESIKVALDNLLPKVEALLMNPVSIVSNSVDTDEEPVASLFRAAENGDTESVCNLLSAGDVDVRHRNEEGDSALHVASRAGHEQVVILLLRKIAVDCPGYRCRTPLHNACTHGHLTVARRLLLADANVEAKDSEGDFAVLFASRAGHLHVLELLANHLASLNSVDKHGNSAMVAAAKSKQWDIVKFLLRRGASAEKYEGEENAPLYLVGKERNCSLITAMLKQITRKEEQMELVLKRCHDTHLLCVFEDALPGFCKTKEGRDVMTTLAEEGKLDVVRAMLDRGADVNGFDSEMSSCLLNAAYGGKVEMVKMLLERCASVDLVHESSNKFTALHYAAQQGHEACVSLLLDAGASVNTKNYWSETPIDVCKTASIRNILKLLSSKS